ncbi:hypothetical protein K503DRAFT_682556 [Rhizopogon vinicolor AM-OR11-026]|uniref:Uncharacterized protein n=1 Tax=Rhizopogon vinicolor AM-OR11-026 TaxID=1314800 RepID=A0A1B7ND75_9AGAM|nr:hypothetical protein K503DRAFT_682556 [Rhizopogon vinicolor AM-OR11-026]
MGKLHLKRTPAEEAERALRKARKAARRSRKRSHLSDGMGEDRESSPRRGRNVTDSYLDEDVYGPPPPPSSSSMHKPDYDAILNELEDARFREKMWDALGDDERLDAIDAKFNDYAHVPNRWRTNAARDGGPTDQRDVDPRFMDDDEYAEWVRDGMWRRKHAQQYEEEARKKAEQAARRARKKEMKAETSRLEKAVEERRKQKRKEREKRREEDARAEYDRRWKDLLDPNAQRHSLSFGDIPWPLFAPTTHSDAADLDTFSIALEHFTATAISAFLIPVSANLALAQDAGASRPTFIHEKKEKKEKLREAMLRFHPDKFEGRVMRKVVETDKDRVREAVGQVARVINTLMEE